MSEDHLRLIEEVKSLFYDDFLIEAHEKITEIESEFKDESEFLRRLNSIEEVSIVKEALSSADQCLGLLSDLDSWELLKDEDDIATFSKGSPNEFVVRAEMIVETSIFPIMALFSEVDLVSSWVEVIEKATLISQPSAFLGLIWYRMNIPWPCSDRDLAVRCIGIPIPENRSVLLCIKSINSPTFLNTLIPPPQGKDIRINIPIGCINMMILDPERTQVSMVIHSNPHLSFIPQSFINYGTKQGVYFFMHTLREKAKNFKGSEFERRVSERSEYYKKIDDFYQRFYTEEKRN